MIIFKEVDKSFFELYDKVSMKVNVQSEYEVKRINGGLGDLLLEEVPVEPYNKDLSNMRKWVIDMKSLILAFNMRPDIRLLYTNRSFLFGVMIIKKTKKGESICIHYIGKANCGFR